MINTTGSPVQAVVPVTPKEYFREFSDNNVSDNIEIHRELTAILTKKKI